MVAERVGEFPAPFIDVVGGAHTLLGEMQRHLQKFGCVDILLLSLTDQAKDRTLGRRRLPQRLGRRGQCLRRRSTFGELR